MTALHRSPRKHARLLREVVLMDGKASCWRTWLADLPKGLPRRLSWLDGSRTRFGNTSMPHVAELIRLRFGLDRWTRADAWRSWQVAGTESQASAADRVGRAGNS